MENDITIGEITKKVEEISSEFERTNSDLKRKYLIWNIQSFNVIASKVKGYKGSFGTGYPFYALDENLEGELPIIEEQLRYNRQLVKDGVKYQKSIWECKSCLEKNYDKMLNLKNICKPCPNVKKNLKPRKIINRLPDMDLWFVCDDNNVEQAKKELEELLKKSGMKTSDVDPLKTIDDLDKVVKDLKAGKKPSQFLPIDCHIIEYSKLKNIIEKVPTELRNAKQNGNAPYIPIHPISYRKIWQYDDDAYNYIYDYFSAFTPFDFPKELLNILENTRKEVVLNYNLDELFDFLAKSATEANFTRISEDKLKGIFFLKMKNWKNLGRANNYNDERD